MKKTLLIVSFAALALGVATLAFAKETPVGKRQSIGGMEIGAVYLQPIEMEPAGMMHDAKDSDVHLEADIHADKDNPNGFAKGDWIPYLAITYQLTKEGSTEKRSGDFMPMVASDGPHYGDNVKMMGAGRYKLVLHVSSPDANPHAHFGRHTDKETGVGPWFKPFDAEFEFTYAGTGKKGAY
jgi:periplasmic iron binding protein